MSAIPYKLTAVLAAAAVTPYAASETELGRQTVTQVSSLFSDDSAGAGTSGLAPGISADPESQLAEYGNHAHYQIEKLRQVNEQR